ncbi:MAG TPA: hypothetical protein VF911_15745, partial [Thermoanaerobaculia bacterium]
ALHYPGYILGQFDYYRSEYEAAPSPEFADVEDLLPNELAVAGAVRAAYEQVLLGRAVGIIRLRDDGQLVSGDVVLGESHHAAAQRLASPDGAPLRKRVQTALAPRLEIAGDVARDLNRLAEGTLSGLDRGIVASLIERYTPEF